MMVTKTSDSKYQDNNSGNSISKTGDSVDGLLTRAVDLLIVAVSFWSICLLCSISMNVEFLLAAVAYVCVNGISMALSKQYFSCSKYSGNTTICAFISNAVGLVIGTTVMLGLYFALPVPDQLFVIVAMSGLMAFFVLGTVTPLLKSA